MKKNVWLAFFYAVLGAEIGGILLKSELLQYIFKPLIIPVLLGYFISQVPAAAGRFAKWIITALFFSWAGDLLLLFQGEKEIFFLLGLVSFLLAHIFYIVFFHQVRVEENVKSKPGLLALVVIYYAALISWLSPYLGDMKLPVRVYGVVISFMFLLAMHMLFIRNKPAGRLMMAGALLFVISDSVLAINKFYQPFEAAGAAIMLSYGIAQLFIVQGAINYLSRPGKNNLTKV